MESEQHSEFLRKCEFLSDFGLSGLTAEHRTIVDRYGYWFSALENGTIEPKTQAQRHFLLVCSGKASATTEHENAWCTYKAILRLDIAMRTNVIEPLLAGDRDAVNKVSQKNLPEFAFDNLVLRLRQEESRAATGEMKLALQDAVIKIREIERGGRNLDGKFSHTNWGGLHSGFGVGWP